MQMQPGCFSHLCFVLFRPLARQVRLSARAPSGVVGICVFALHAQAARFARACLPARAVVRPFGGLFAVSVPLTSGARVYAQAHGAQV